MKKIENDPAEVNLSYTAFFLLATLGLTFLFSQSFGELRNVSGLVLLGYALLLYFMWDFIRQLYSPGQSVFLYTLTFIILPFAMNWLLKYPYAQAGLAILVGAYIAAGIAEWLYEYLIKRKMPRNILKRIVLIDNKVDKSMVDISTHQLALYEYRGLAFALILIASYFTLTYLLFHR